MLVIRGSHSLSELLRSLFYFRSLAIVKKNVPFRLVQLSLAVSLALFVALSLAPCLTAQAQNDPAALQRRLSRARALAAVGQLTEAVSELEAIRAATNDDTLRDVARVLLMGVYLEQANYLRAEALLDDAYRARATNEETASVYFALSGQMVNGIRARIERYRTFGLNFTEGELPREAQADLEGLRRLLERIIEQARGLQVYPPTRAGAVALLEDGAGVRLVLARNPQERVYWQRELADARQRLIGADPRLARAQTPAVVANAANSPAPQRSAPAINPAPEPPGETAPNNPLRVTPQTTRSAPARQPNSAAQTPATASAAQNRQANGSAQLHEVGSLNNRATQRAQPAYPAIARSARVSGVVTVYLVVDENGEVADVQRANGHTLLQQAAIEAARRWRFRPMQVEGQNVKMAGYISFNFTL